MLDSLNNDVASIVARLETNRIPMQIWNDFSDQSENIEVLAVNCQFKMFVQAYKNVELNFSLTIHLPDREREGRAWMLGSENVKGTE